MAASYEYIKYTPQGAPSLSEDGLTVTQNIIAISNQVGNTYVSRYKSDLVQPAPTFLLANSANAPTLLQAAAVAFIAKTYPNT